MDINGKPSTIRLKVSTGGHYEEARAAGAITPGHLLQMEAAGTLLKHATAVVGAQKMFATEDVNVLQGKGIGDVFAIGDLVSYVNALPGDEIYAWLKDGENVVKGDKLSSAGDGTLKKTVTTDVVIAEADEALNLVGGAAAAERIRIRVR